MMLESCMESGGCLRGGSGKFIIEILVWSGYDFEAKMSLK